jgi:hypothetical protein
MNGIADLTVAADSCSAGCPRHLRNQIAADGAPGSVLAGGLYS